MSRQSAFPNSWESQNLTVNRFLLAAGYGASAIAAAVAPAAQAVEYLSVQAAQKALFPDATEFLPLRLSLTADQWREVELKSRSSGRGLEYPVFRATRDGKPLGTVYIDEVLGKTELITYALGVSVEGKVQQIEILNYRETHGYEVRNAKWRRQFVGKDAADAVTLGIDIGNISGATLSCRHVTDGVRRLLAIHAIARSTP